MNNQLKLTYKREPEANIGGKHTGLTEPVRIRQVPGDGGWGVRQMEPLFFYFFRISNYCAFVKLHTSHTTTILPIPHKQPNNK